MEQMHALLTGTREHRDLLNDGEKDDMATAAACWANMLRHHGVDPADPVVGATILVMAKSLTHFMDTRAELRQFSEANMIGSRWAVATAAHVGASLYESARAGVRA